MDNNKLNNVFGNVLSKLDPNNNLQIIKTNGLFTIKNEPSSNSTSSNPTSSNPTSSNPTSSNSTSSNPTSSNSTSSNPTSSNPNKISQDTHTMVNSIDNHDNVLTSKSGIKNNFNTIFGKYFSNINSDHEFTINNDGVSIRNREKDRINEHRRHRLNEIVDAQLDNSETIYSSIHLQFILFFISTLILIGFVFIINASGDLSIFVVILLLLFLFLVFKFLRFNIINFISNFRF